MRGGGGGGGGGGVVVVVVVVEDVGPWTRSAAGQRLRRNG
jgi:hypothetical protein